MSSQGIVGALLGFRTKEELWQAGQRKSHPANKRVVVILSSKSKRESFSQPEKSMVLLYGK